MQWNSNIFVHKVRSSSTKLQTHDKSHCGHLTNMFGLRVEKCAFNVHIHKIVDILIYGLLDLEWLFFAFMLEGLFVVFDFS